MGRPGRAAGLFWAKLVFVLTLTAAAVAIHPSHAVIRCGEAAEAARLPKLGLVVGVSSLLAVYAFG